LGPPKSTAYQDFRVVDAVVRFGEDLLTAERIGNLVKKLKELIESQVKNSKSP